MKIIEQSYSLYKNEQITADHLATIIPYVLVKAKIDRILSHYNYIQAFHFSVNQGDITSVVQTNLDIAMTRLKSNDFDEHILKVDPNFFNREKELENKIKNKRANRSARKLQKMASESSGDSGASKDPIKRKSTLPTAAQSAMLEQIIETANEPNE